MGQNALIPCLFAFQKIYGYLPQPVSAQIGQILHVPLAGLSSVINFYNLLYYDPASVINIM
jgi:NADH:ubiquinone oxidoreductase subunit E